MDIRRACSLVALLGYLVLLVFVLRLPDRFAILVGTLVLSIPVVSVILLVWFPGRFPIRRWMRAFQSPLLRPCNEDFESKSEDVRQGWSTLLGPLWPIVGGILWYLIYYLVTGHAQ